MQPEWSPRISWTDLPGPVQAGIEEILGAPVAEAAGQQGGFSPGSADRVLTATGRRAFVKAVGPQPNEQSPAIHRKEAAIAAVLPDSVPAPSLIGTFDDGAWVALVLTDVEGRHPHVPWHSAELSLVLDALLELSRTPVPPELEHLPRLEHELTEAFQGWTRIRESTPDDCDPWILANLDTLEQLAGSGLRDLAGESLVHTDIRADNLLITADNEAILVDWPWATVGAPWVDAVTVLVNVRVFNPAFDVDAMLDSHAVFTTATPENVDRFLSGLAAYFMDAARQPPPPGLPTVRAFQQRQGEAVIHWLRERLASSGSGSGSGSLR
ncbi:aminoglycoside phosphotransferase family protein [Arthrobacter sp. ISL-48]|uniref:aminoglycoside phosphotransferase family protein n=1 Tax=Arthrobacter sp. ISL-48 TaxID=2819110 RepID=UPI001BE566FD|nr:aminoglycoside phosphotransferase family protein [Arthrobacter sp. ISL-48]MBT2531065.1 aminoglycoside phosphotransferase family protein [Arthrobacter sp. ISL-48]